jgi:hypothetical protein
VMTRRHPTLAGRSVGEVFAEEKERLIPLPNPMPTADLVLPVAVDKTASVRLGTNRYSAPRAGDPRVSRSRGDRRERSSGGDARAVGPSSPLRKRPREGSTDRGWMDRVRRHVDGTS